MKGRLAKFLIGVALVAPVMSGCSSEPFPFPGGGGFFNNSGNNPASGMNGKSGTIQDKSVSPTASAPTYAGDKNRKVQTITNIPVSEYSSDTMNKIAKMFRALSGQVSDTNVEMIAKYMINLGIGETLADKIADTVYTYQSFGARKNFNANKLIDVCYDTLAIINSIDASKIGQFLDFVNNDRENAERENLRRELNSLNIHKYYGTNLNGVNYSRFELLNSLYYDIQDTSLRNILDTYQYYFDKYSFSPKQEDNFNRYQDDLYHKLNFDSLDVIPYQIVNFFYSHAQEAKEVLVNDLKLIVDAIGPVVFDYVEIFRAPSNELQMRNQYSGVYLTDKSYNKRMHEFLTNLIQNKNTILGLFNSILSDKKLGNLLLDVTSEILIPLAKERNEGNDDIIDELETFERRINAISADHISALFTFAFKLLNQVQPSDLKSMIDYFFLPNNGGITTSTENFLFSLGDKYISKLDAVISGLSARDKNLIIEASEIFGIDIITELQDFSKMYQSKNISSSYSREMFYEEMSDWASTLTNKFIRPLNLLFSGGEKMSPNSSSEDYGTFEDYIREEYQILKLSDRVVLRISSNSSFYEGDNVTPSNLRFQYGTLVYPYQTYYSSNYFSHSTYYFDGDPYEIFWQSSNSTINYLPDMARDYISSPSFNELSESEQNWYFELSDLYFGSEYVNLDTNNIGKCPLYIEYQINGCYYNLSLYVDVYPTNLPYLESTTFSYSTRGNAYTLNSDYGYYYGDRAFELYATVILTDNEGNNIDTLDTSYTGWHCYYRRNYSNDYSYYLYYVVDPDSLNDYIDSQYSVVGSYIKGRDDFYDTPYVDVHCTLEDGSQLSLSKSLAYDYSLIAGKESGKEYSITVNGYDFYYVILSMDSPAYTSYSFRINNIDTQYGIVNPTNITATVITYLEYEEVINGTLYRINEELDVYTSMDVTLENFTYYNGVATFKYKGQTFTFDYYA